MQVPLASLAPQIKCSSLFSLGYSVSPCFLLALFNFPTSFSLPRGSWLTTEFKWVPLVPTICPITKRTPPPSEECSAALQRRLLSRSCHKCPQFTQFLPLLTWMRVLLPQLRPLRGSPQWIPGGYFKTLRERLVRSQEPKNRSYSF